MSIYENNSLLLLFKDNTTALSFHCFILYTQGPWGICLYQKVVYIVDTVSVHAGALLSKEKLWCVTVCSIFPKSLQYSTGCILTHSHTLSHKLSLHVFAAFFGSIAITGPQQQNQMIDWETKNTLEYPSPLHTTELHCNAVKVTRTKHFLVLF